MSSGKAGQKVFFASIFIIPSLLCLGFYYFVIRDPITKGKKNIFVKLPHYGPSSLVNNDSVFYQIPLFGFSNDQSSGISEEELKNKIVIYSCMDPHQKQSIQLASQLFRIQDKLSYLKKHLLIITIGTCYNNTNMQAFGDKVHANPKLWKMTMMPPSLAKRTFLEDLKVNADDFIHSNDTSVYCNSLILVDRERHIRGYYKAITVKEADRLIDETVVLAAEYGKFKQMK